MNAQKLEALLAGLTACGQDPEGGVTRFLYDESWRDAQTYLQKTFSEAGMSAYFDAIGNLYGRAEGSEPGVVLTGSHVDTVRQGGHLDGQFGIIAGFVAIQQLLERYGKPKKTLEVVSLAEEEGSRFPYGFWGSKNVVGIDDRAFLKTATDGEGISFVDAMADSGFDIEAPNPARTDIEAFVEVHIEQGQVLETLKKTIGVVTTVVGIKRYSVTIKGKANHAGTTPMGLRADALEWASRAMIAIIDKAKSVGDPLVVTFGKVEVKPNVPNVIPGEATFSIDIRHTEQEALDSFAIDVEAMIQSLMPANVEAIIESWMDQAPIPMDKNLVSLVEAACKENKVDYQLMASGAGHDAQIFAPHFPATMFFVPSIEGISHNPKEATRMEDLLVGIEVLMDILYKLAY